MHEELKELLKKYVRKNEQPKEVSGKPRFKKGDKWDEYVLRFYKEMHSERFSRNLKNTEFFEKRRKIPFRIINPIDMEWMRVYCILTPWILDGIVEFKVELNEEQIASAKKRGLTGVDILMDEKSRWVMAGTMLVDQHDLKTLYRMGSSWSQDLFRDSLRILFGELHNA